ncbi:peptide ABC transporter substrate-binding protein [Actomonas aquatica]|uniref:Peptide ABC transporter substrate-binding protein n=1 Tax=Actomonas aquatica TaxID=2866162 RepID=A0ABZ1C5Z8_9BACT|nr:peptide ABC transporter substrate-binding protein [Opitutus sp. WL0086]WRQ86752.1 peptide ABC transporter substrate-binding protein [Opitutus sp. WL0086]
MPLPRLRLFVLLTLVAGAVLASGCGRRESIAEAAIATQTLHVASTGEPSELDPAIINAPPDFKIVPMLFEGLLIADPTTLEARPGVAARWDVSADGLTYTFHLRPDARWSNGDPVTAADFLFSWQRVLSPALGSQYTFLFDNVVGASDFAAGRSNDFTTVGFGAPDASTVTITLNQPTPYFPVIVANNPVWAPVHRATVESVGSATARGTGWTKPGTMVTNGPFHLTEWRPNDVIRLEKSPNYWDASHVRLNAVVYHAYDNLESAERAFRAGQLHRTERVPPSRLPVYREQGEASLLREVPSLIARFVNLNTRHPPLDDPRVRRALALALDREAITARVYFDDATPAHRVVPTSLTGYPTTADFSDDLAAARAELAAAGYPNGDGFPVLELSTESGGTRMLAEILQAQWKDGLGIQVEILVSESRVHWSRLQHGEYTVAAGGWVADYADATAFLDLWRTDSGWNFTGWSDPAYDAALDHAATLRDPADRAAALREAEHLLMQAMPIVPLANQNVSYLRHPAVRGLQENPMDRADYRTVWLEAPAADSP